MPQPFHELTLCVTVNSFQSAKSGEMLHAVEIRDGNSITQLQTFENLLHAKAYAAIVARKLGRLIDIGIEMLEA